MISKCCRSALRALVCVLCSCSMFHIRFSVPFCPFVPSPASPNVMPPQLTRVPGSSPNATTQGCTLDMMLLFSLNTDIRRSGEPSGLFFFLQKESFALREGVISTESFWEKMKVLAWKTRQHVVSIMAGLLCAPPVG